MKNFISWAAIGLLFCVPLGTCRAFAQIGTPTAPPPGGANAAGTAGTARAARPAGTAGTASPAGTTSPAGRAGTAKPATRLSPRTFDPSVNSNPSSRLFDPSVSPRGLDPSTGRVFSDPTTGQTFGGNPGMLDRGPTTGSTAGRSPSASVRGRPNFSGGSTSATLRPSGSIAGPANDPRSRDARGIDPRLDANIAAEAAALNAPFAPVIPLVPLAPEAFVAPGAEASPLAPRTATAPVILNSGENEASGRNDVKRITPVTPREPAPQIEGTATATATAFPSRNPTATGDVTVSGAPAGVTNSPAADFTEVFTEGRNPPVRGYRGIPSSTGQRSGLTYSYPGYTLWQGYYWYRSPSSAWNYWDGSRWVQFDSPMRQ